jgi:hypothetical protein
MVTSRAVAPKRAFGFVVVLGLAFLFALMPAAIARNAGKTVRHHKVQEQDPAADQLAEAESDIEKRDYANAEFLLKKYLEAQSENYAAWYDLGVL